jgi:hypothetical protein
MNCTRYSLSHVNWRLGNHRRNTSLKKLLRNASKGLRRDHGTYR